MLSLKGTGVHKGIAVGKLVFYERQLFHVEKQTQEDTQIQVQRYRQAKEQAVMQVQTLHKLALREISSENAAIFQAHHLLLEDQDFNGYVLELIKNQHTGAEYAVQQAAETFYRMFSSIPDPYLQQRAIDVQDVAHRLISNLTYGKVELFVPEYPSILASDELVPSEVIQLPRDKVLAFVTKSGSENSHAAIITRDRNIPYLLGVGEGLDRSCQGLLAAVDTYTGRLYIDPDPATLHRLEEKQRREQERLQGLNHLIGKPNRTIDGREVKIFASITEPLDIEQVIRSDADGLGLMRSEFLYLKRDGLPGEEEQVSAYREVIRQMKGDGHPHAGLWRTQADRAAEKQTGDEPIPRISLYPHLPCHAADVSDPAAGNLSGSLLWSGQHPVPDGGQCRAAGGNFAAFTGCKRIIEAG